MDRAEPFGRLAPRRVVTLPVENVRPAIRIAHRLHGPLNIPRRIIFDHELVLILAGRGELSFDDGQVPLSPGTLLVIPPFVPHAFASFGIVDHAAIHFDLAPNVPDAGGLADRRPYEVRLTHGLALPRQSPAGRDVESTFDRIIAAHSNRSPLEELEAANLLTRLLIDLIRFRSRDAAGRGELRNQSRIERVLAYVAGHFAEPMTVERLAEVAGLSASRFSALFRAHVGSSPMDYVRRVRVDEARRLLADVDLSVKEVARRVGFEDGFHFSKVFRAVDGLPPTRYREALLAGRMNRDELEAARSGHRRRP